MVKVISKIKQPYDYVWGQGDPAFFWKRNEEIVQSPWKDLLDHTSYSMWMIFREVIINSSDINAYVLYIGEIPYFIISKRNEHRALQEPEFCASNIEILEANNPNKIRRLKEVKEQLFQKTEKVRNDYDSPVILFTRKQVYVDLDLAREDFLYKYIINKFDLSAELIAQQIEQWFANRSVRMMDRGQIQNDREKLISHGFDKRISFRHRNGD